MPSPPNNSVAFRPAKNGHNASKPPLNSLKVDRTTPPLVYLGEKVGIPPRGNQSVCDEQEVSATYDIGCAYATSRPRDVIGIYTR